MVADIHDAEVDKLQRKKFQPLGDPPDYSSKKCSWKFEKNSVFKNSEAMLQISENIEPRSSVNLTKVNLGKSNLRKV